MFFHCSEINWLNRCTPYKKHLSHITVTDLWWHTSAPYMYMINYVNMQHNSVNLRLIYVDMQHNYVDMQVINFCQNYFFLRVNFLTYAIIWHYTCNMQHNYVKMRLIYVNMQHNYVNMRLIYVNMWLIDIKLLLAIFAICSVSRMYT